MPWFEGKNRKKIRQALIRQSINHRKNGFPQPQLTLSMPVFEADAIVLRQYSLADSDRIIVFITREFGKIRGVAQGVKKTQSRMAGSLEPFNHVRVECWNREGKDLCQIRRVDLIHTFFKKGADYRQICAYSYFSEIMNEIIQENQSNDALFRLLLSSLHAGELHAVNAALISYFEIWSLRLSGLWPHYAYCSYCGKCVKGDEFFVWIETGQIRCAACAQGRGLRMRAQASAFLEEIFRLSPDQIVLRTIQPDALIDIERLSQKLLSMAFEKQLKSYRMLKEAFQSG
jgi:DNA repair protein RecO (recombination protein O)